MMNRLRHLAGLLTGLFVDDRAFAFGIIVWIGVVRLALVLLACPPMIASILLFLGFGVLLALSVALAARRS
jgi:hypothetical protein